MENSSIYYYQTPCIGTLRLSFSSTGLFEIDFWQGEITQNKVPVDDPNISSTFKWLDAYFAERDPGFIPSINIRGTAFQLKVFEALLSVPYGKTVTYKELGDLVYKSNGGRRVSYQAIGQALKRNPIPIIVPCHRVIGSDGSLTGYAGGFSIKKELLRLEKFFPS